jgi:hypothetical protein
VNAGEVVMCLGADERGAGQKGGMRRQTVFVLKVARWCRAKGRGKGGPTGAFTWRRKKEDMGSCRGGRQLRVANNGPRPSGVGDAGDGVSVADGWDRGEAGPGGSGRGTREKGESGTGHQWDADMRARVAQCLAVWFKPDLKQKSEFKWFKTFSNCFKF